MSTVSNVSTVVTVGTASTGECLAGIKFGESLHQKWLAKKFGECLQLIIIIMK